MMNKDQRIISSATILFGQLEIISNLMRQGVVLEADKVFDMFIHPFAEIKHIKDLASGNHPSLTKQVKEKKDVTRGKRKSQLLRRRGLC